MRESAEVTIGERVRLHREQQHRTQAVVAGLAGITVDYLSQIERGLRTPTIAVVHQLARVLRVRTSALLGEPPLAEEAPPRAPLAALQRALLGLESGSLPAAPMELNRLRERVDAAWKGWQSSPSRFSDVGPLLPALVVDVEAAVHRVNGRDSQLMAALRMAADLHFLLRTYCKRSGRNDLALLAADRGLRAAVDAEDGQRTAAARWNLAHALMAEGEPRAAAEVALDAAADLRSRGGPMDRTTAALVGALHLVAAIGAVREGEVWQARHLLRHEAGPIAAHVGETNVFWTAFGPTNVGLHAVSIEMEAGEAAEGLRLAGEVDVDRAPSIERRATFFLEQARCHHQRREDEAVLLHLLNAERQSPQDVGNNALARDLVRGLLRRARPSLAPEVRRLAGRVGLTTA
jgi:transcriptional regulator with XRE-family HTH domain